MSNHNICPRQKRNFKERLWKIQKGKCYYCGDLVLPMSFISKSILKFNNPYGTVTYMDAGIIILTKYATLDHINPRANGGKNEFTNMRLACADCNGMRGCNK